MRQVHMMSVTRVTPERQLFCNSYAVSPAHGQHAKSYKDIGPFRNSKGLQFIHPSWT